jgi:hypothetical protein
LKAPPCGLISGKTGDGPRTPIGLGTFKKAVSAAAGEIKPEAYPLGYVEDFIEPRTKLPAFFNVPL